MKNISFFLFTFLCATSQAQIITFPDANFKAKLTNSACAILFTSGTTLVNPDVNQNGEIEVVEAQNVKFLNVNNSSINSLVGISNFSGLNTLECDGNSITSLDVSMLTNLTSLYCTNNQLTSLLLNTVYIPNTAHYTLYCSFNQLATLHLGTMNIDRLSCDNNHLTMVNASQIQGLYEGYFNNNQLASLVLADVPAIDRLNISNNPIASFAYPTTVMNFFYCHDTPITALDFSHATHGYKNIFIYNNTNLEYINFKNGVPEDCVLLPMGPDECNFQIYNNPALQFVCVDENGFESYSLAGVIQTPNVIFSSYCSFTPGGSYNTVTGNIRLDLNGNGCNASDNPMVYLPVNFSTGSSSLGSTFTDSIGNYLNYISNGNVTITPQYQLNYFTISPASYTTNFTGTGGSSVVDFCITPNGVHNDLEVVIMPTNSARPGFNASYNIVYKNKGNQVQSGTVALTFEDDVLDFVSTNPVITTQSSNTLSWDFTNFVPFETRVINVTLNVNSPQETPAVTIGDILDFNVALSTAQTDETPNNNQFDFHQTVVGSFDPNDKVVIQGSQISIANVGDYLNYVVRFQNTGTYLAENVVIKDMLSSKLNWGTLEMVSSSHPFRSTLTISNQLEVFYEGINLPPSSVDEPGSHGFITFKIKPKSNVVINDVISNTANIYFDFNFPIVTNTVATTVTALGTNDFNQSAFSLYPNPTTDFLSVKQANNNLIKEVSVYNTLGQKLWSVINTETIDVRHLPKGTYLITVATDSGKGTQKFVKL
jgi:uncharacterized repeat protein (TIGR01451 family)